MKSREGDGWRVKEARGCRWLREQRFHVAPQSLVAGTRLAEKRGASVRLARQRVVIEPRDRWTAKGAPHFLHANPIHPAAFSSTITSCLTPALSVRLSPGPTISSMEQT